MNRKTLLEKAAHLTSVDREKEYGSAENNFTLIANYWTLWIEARFGVTINLEHVDVAMMMDDVKKARLGTNIKHADSWVDKAGYTAIGGELALAEDDLEIPAHLRNATHTVMK